MKRCRCLTKIKGEKTWIRCDGKTRAKSGVCIDCVDHRRSDSRAKSGWVCSLAKV